MKIQIGTRLYGLTGSDFADSNNSLTINIYKIEKVYKNGDIKFEGLKREKLNDDSGLFTRSELENKIKKWLGKK